MKKRFLSIFLMLALAFSLFAVSASASDITPKGNGYQAISFKFNGKSYAAVLTARYDAALGGCTQITTEAAVRVNLGKPKVEYDTINYGYITDIGDGATAMLTDSVHALSTHWVKCKYGMNQVEECISVSGVGDVIVHNRRYGGSVYMNPIQ